MFTKITIFLSLYLIGLVKSSKILVVIPTPSISHQVVFRPLIQELVRRGHEVTVITTDPAFPKGHTPVNLTEIDVHDISYKAWADVLTTSTGHNNDVKHQFVSIMRTMGKVFEVQVSVEEVQDIIHKRKGEFDLLLLEAYFNPILVFTHIYKDVPAIHMSSFGGLQHNYDIVGASTHPLLYPTVTHQRLYHLTNYEKLQQLYNRWRVERSFDIIQEEYDSLLQKLFGRDVPPIQDLYNNVDMLFFNNHPIWADNQPVPSTVVYIGGIHNPPPKELPKNIQYLLNGSRNGVIYFSLGTNVVPSSLPPNKLQIMKKAFSQLPYDVIWKWNLDTMPDITENIKLFKWLPQADLLKHPKVKLFITQGGLQSTDEAIDAGVPLVGIPMLADQWYNTEKYPHLKIGLKLDLATLTEKEFKEAIENVISDKSYRENIKKLRSVMKDEPQSPLERAVWWTEYVLRHGGAKHLRAAGANVSWAQYLELELVAIVVLILVTSFVLLLLALYVIWKLLIGANFKLKLKSS